eukprot:GILK01008602.1.p1 GENE.GILK01008602.1~~GILK01008602.1.p1  ORF type:complete len:651 (+),score=129.12 GILK01008602.1:157-2109(+)
MFKSIEQRQRGEFRNTSAFRCRSYGGESFVKRLKLDRKLKKHRGCVNTINWSENGEYLVSGSDDTNICVWDYATRNLQLCIESGHSANIFCTKFMPTTLDHVVSCAGDSEVRLFDIHNAHAPSVYTCHGDRVKKLAVEPGNPHIFLSAGEDGSVRFFDSRQPHNCNRSSTCSNALVSLKSGRFSTVEINSISSSELKPYYFAIGGGDAHVRLYDRRMLSPVEPSAAAIMNRPCAQFKPKNINSAHITAVCMNDAGSEVIASYSGSSIFLFDIDNNGSNPYPGQQVMDALGRGGTGSQTSSEDYVRTMKTKIVLYQQKGRYSRVVEKCSRLIKKLNKPSFEIVPMGSASSVLSSKSADRCFAYYQRALAYYHLEQPTLALRDVTRSLAIGGTEDTHKGRWLKAKVYYELSRYNDAIQTCQGILESHTDVYDGSTLNQVKRFMKVCRSQLKSEERKALARRNRAENRRKKSESTSESATTSLDVDMGSEEQRENAVNKAQGSVPKDESDQDARQVNSVSSSGTGSVSSSSMDIDESSSLANDRMVVKRKREHGAEKGRKVRPGLEGSGEAESEPLLETQQAERQSNRLEAGREEEEEKEEQEEAEEAEAEADRVPATPTEEEERGKDVEMDSEEVEVVMWLLLLWLLFMPSA